MGLQTSLRDVGDNFKTGKDTRACNAASANAEQCSK